jgi:TPR repeat protein
VKLERGCTSPAFFVPVRVRPRLSAPSARAALSHAVATALVGVAVAACERNGQPSLSAAPPQTTAPQVSAEPARPLGTEDLATALLREQARSGTSADRMALAARLDQLIGERLGDLSDPAPWARIEATQRELFNLRSAAAHDGDRSAQAQLAIAYLGGHGVAPDRDQARRLADAAAAAGAPRGWVAQGQILAAEGNAAEACAMFQRAATSDDRLGLFYEGACVAYGWDGQPANFDKARPLLERATAAGDALAPAVLAERLRNAPDAQRDPARAFELLQLGAQRGSLPAMTELARVLWFDTGPRQDKALARRWLERAARSGHPAARWHYALALEQGAGGPVNTPAALLWNELALDGASGEHLLAAQTGRERLALQLDAEQKAAVQALLRDFKPSTSVASLSRWDRDPAPQQPK